MKKLIVLLAMVLSLPALADTRDEVMAGMQRCRAIVDDRAWLDCTYGAEQPMRAKLGLAPAPDYQQRLVPPVGVMAPAAAMAPAEPGSRKPAPVSHRKATFLQILTGTAAPLAVSNLASVDYDRQGAFLVTLDNGQVWHQVDPDSGPRARLKLGAKVTITPGALGSYNFKASDSTHVYKVEPRT
jgi:hypothetical protein